MRLGELCTLLFIFNISLLGYLVNLVFILGYFNFRLKVVNIAIYINVPLRMTFNYPQFLNSRQASLLSIATQTNNIKAVNIFLSNGAEVNQAGQKGATPLYIASQHGYLDIVNRFLKIKGIEINKALFNGQTPVLIAISHGHVKVVEALLNAGAKVNHAIKNGITPLAMAARKGNIKIVAALLSAGARNDNTAVGTPAEIAKKYGHEEVYRTITLFSLGKQNRWGQKALESVSKITNNNEGAVALGSLLLIQKIINSLNSDNNTEKKMKIKMQNMPFNCSMFLEIKKLANSLENNNPNFHAAVRKAISNTSSQLYSILNTPTNARSHTTTLTKIANKDKKVDETVRQSM